MKILHLFLFICISSISFTQTDAQRYENASFLVHQKGETAYTTIITAKDTPFTDEEFNRLKSDFLKKEGIFGVEFSKNNKTIYVHHLSFIEIETIKYFAEPIKQNNHYSERIEYTF